VIIYGIYKKANTEVSCHLSYPSCNFYALRSVLSILVPSKESLGQILDDLMNEKESDIPNGDDSPNKYVLENSLRIHVLPNLNLR